VKAAVLVEHLARNHPLPDSNKRAAFLSAWLFLEVNGRHFAGEDPDTDVPMWSESLLAKRPPNEIASWLEEVPLHLADCELVLFRACGSNAARCVSQRAHPARQFSGRP